MKTPPSVAIQFFARLPLVLLALLALGAGALAGAAKLHPHTARPRPPIIRPVKHAATAVAAANPNKAKAMKPNLDVSVYRRCFAPNETVHLNLSAFNAPIVQFAAYRLDLGAVVTKSGVMQDFSKTLRALPLPGKPAATWRAAVKTLPDQWAGADVKAPKLAPGAYLLVVSANAHGATVEKRTWLAVTGVTLLAKRSLGELLVYAADINSGHPVANVPLRLCDEKGPFGSTQATSADGVLRTGITGASGSLWAYAPTARGPAFAIAAAPDAPAPYAVYTVTDRPVYRPGNLVQYKATIRQRVENADTPGGFDWKPYAAQPAVLEIRDATDALVEQHTVSTDANGALSGSVQLAAEPSLGEWHLVIVLGKDKHRVYSSFSVQAYRKPEMNVTVKFDHEHYLGGSPVPVTINAQYFYGRPVTGARVRYQVSFSQQSGYGTQIEPGYNAVGSTDSQGHLIINIPTKRVAADREVSVQATVTDLSRRSAQGSGSTLIAGGLYRLSLGGDKSVYHPGERIVMTARATDYDDKPVAGAKVRIRMVEHKQDNQHRPYDETTTREAVTGADGTASANFSTPRESSLEFHAESYDAQQDRITADSQVQVTADKEWLSQAQPTPPILALSADKDQYSPGETARLTIDTLLTHRPAQPAEKVSGGVLARPARNVAWALVTLEGENLGMTRVVHLTGRKTVIPIPLAVRDFPSITVNVAIIQDRQLYEQQQTLTVLMPGKVLNVAITPDKQTYQPGDTATYTITTRDTSGGGLPADVSLGVVDSSIYDIQADNSEDMKDVFYNGQAVRLTSSYSFAAQYSGGGYQVMPGVAMKAMPAVALYDTAASAAPAPPSIRVRNQFADTAYWNAGVETGADGTARVSFTVPDNLTKWRATARAITLDTKIGSATNDVTSVMPLLVRLELPRFFVQGDKTIVSAIIQNGTADARTVHISMQPQGATLDASSALEQTMQLPASGQQRIDWPVTIGSVQQASFTVTADGGAGGRDAAQGTLPVYPNGVETVTAKAFTLSGADTRQSIDLTQLPSGASLMLILSPSLASSVTDAVDDLAAKPVGDAGETADALMADVAAARALHDAGKPGVIGNGQDLNAYVGTALQKLYRYQHPDGGWNWWEFDQTDGDMTASVLAALAQANASGFPVDSQRLLRGADALRRLLKDDEELNSRADWLLTLSEVAPADAQAPLLELYAERDKLGTYSQASLAIGLAHVATLDAKNDAAAQDARTVTRELSAAATVEGRTANWPLQPGDSGCLWSGDDVALTAHVLRTLLTVSPDDEHIAGAVRWLMANRSGKSWDSTHASAEAVLALSQYIEQTGERAPDYTAQALLDGASIGTLNAKPNADAAPLTISLSPEQLAGHKTLTIQRQGAAGTLYVSEVVTSLTPPIAAVPQMHGITVKRQFRLAVDNPALSNSIPSGSGMDIILDIDADMDYRYVKVEDHLPAGFEVTSGDTDDNNLGGGNGGFPIDFSDGDVGYARRQTRDDRVEFDFDSLPKGHTQLTYHLSAETPGVYNIRDAQAALTYQPEVRGSTILAQVTVGE